MHWQLGQKATPASTPGPADTDFCRRQEFQSFSLSKREANSFQLKAKATEHTALMFLQLIYCAALIPVISFAIYFLSSHLFSLWISATLAQWGGQDILLLVICLTCKISFSLSWRSTQSCFVKQAEPYWCWDLPHSCTSYTCLGKYRGAHPHVLSKWSDHGHINNKVNAEPENEQMFSRNQWKVFRKSIHLC